MRKQKPGIESAPGQRSGSGHEAPDASPGSALDMFVAMVVAAALLLAVPWGGRHAVNGASKWMHAEFQARCAPSHPAGADVARLLCLALR